MLVAQGIEQDPPAPADTGFTPDWNWSAEQFMATEIMYAFGGQKHWKDKSWNLAFDVVAIANEREVKRLSYQWNRSTNQCIAAGTTPDGRPWLVNFSDVTTRTGTATVGGKPVLKRELSQILATTAQDFTEHLREMLLPFFLLDSGVVLTMAPDTTLPDKSQQTSGLDAGMMQSGGGPSGGPSGGPGGGPSGGPGGGSGRGQLSTLIAEFTIDSLQPSIYTIFVDNTRGIKGVESQMGDRRAFWWWDKIKRFGDIRLRIATRRETFDRDVAIQYENIKLGKFELKEEG
ncbi:MAG: hypothetical protein IT211_04870 [Armatimonadetes bacterium]|nr:hypothetical protein [Armatimonadota bacterium]